MNIYRRDFLKGLLGAATAFVAMPARLPAPTPAQKPGLTPGVYTRELDFSEVEQPPGPFTGNPRDRNEVARWIQSHMEFIGRRFMFEEQTAELYQRINLYLAPVLHSLVLVNALHAGKVVAIPAPPGHRLTYSCVVQFARTVEFTEFKAVVEARAA